MNYPNRESWLDAAVVKLRPMLPKRLPKRVRVSVGFPKGRHGTGPAVGQCWPASASTDKTTQIFISPTIGAVGVLPVLLHELIHACFPKDGHRGAFPKVARQVGLEGRMTATHAGARLKVRLNEVARALGPYPHGRLRPGMVEHKQGTRLLKVACGCCGYVVRVTDKWLKVGFPACPKGVTMELAE